MNGRTFIEVIARDPWVFDEFNSRHFGGFFCPIHTIVRTLDVGRYVGPTLISSPRTKSDNRVTNSVLKTHEKKMSGSELEFKLNATQSSRRDDMLTHLIAPNETTRSAAILS